MATAEKKELATTKGNEIATAAAVDDLPSAIIDIAPMLSTQSEVHDIAMAEDDDEMGLSMFTQAKAPSGKLPKDLQWSIESELESKHVETVDGFIACYASRAVLFKSDDSVAGEKPVLVAGSPAGKSMRYGYLTGDPASMDFGELDPKEFEKCKVKDDEGRDAYLLENLSYAQWDSGRNGVGKRMKESRFLFMLTEHEMFPIWLTIGSGSLGDVTKFLNGLCRKQGVDYRRLAYSIGLARKTNSRGTEFAKATISTIKGDDGKAIMLPKETMLEIARTYGDPINAVLERSLHSGGSSLDVNDGGLE
ncbi:hypothetical protein [Kordiimonas sp.]|uniref:hypothetical protein n=1 Tax=Kordiimonas sp. TaxID=1970157 RepID=UPI003A935C1C